MRKSKKHIYLLNEMHYFASLEPSHAHIGGFTFLKEAEKDFDKELRTHKVELIHPDMRAEESVPVTVHRHYPEAVKHCAAMADIENGFGDNALANVVAASAYKAMVENILKRNEGQKGVPDILDIGPLGDFRKDIDTILKNARGVCGGDMVDGLTKHLSGDHPRKISASKHRMEIM